LKNKIDLIISGLESEFPPVVSEAEPGVQPKPGKSDPLDVLIATMLSQNTTDKTSFRAFENLKKNFRSWEEVMTAPLVKIRSAIKVCGLANQKSKSIKKMLKEMKSKYGKLNLDFIRDLSDDKIYEELLQYDGVGIKTVSCVLAFGLGRDVFPVDTHVHRVSNRLGIAKSKTPDKTFEQLRNVIPRGKKFLLHTLLIKFGRKICKAQNPFCSKCRLYDICEFEDKEHYAQMRANNPSQPVENNFIILEHI